jgi:hypothetical protein
VRPVSSLLTRINASHGDANDAAVIERTTHHATKDFSMLLTLIKADSPAPSLESLTRINVAEATPA